MDGLLLIKNIQKIMLTMKIMQEKINLEYGKADSLSPIDGEKKIDNFTSL